MTVIVTGYEDDERWGFSANLFLVNKSDKTVMFSVDEASVNGFMADPAFCGRRSARKMCVQRGEMARRYAGGKRD